VKKLERAGKWLVDRVLGSGMRATKGPPSVRAGVDLETVAPGVVTDVVAPGVVREILVVRPHNQMGDMLLGTPLFKALRRGYPLSRITLVVSPDNAEIMREHPDIDEQVLFDKKRFQRRPAEAWGFLRLLRSRRWDLVIMPTTVSFSVTSAILAWLAPCTVRVGSDGSDYGRAIGRRVFDVQVPCCWENEHQADRNLDFARVLGLDVTDRSPSMGLTEEERSDAREVLAVGGSAGRRAIGIHPGAGKRPNRWPAERFGLVASALAGDEEDRIYVMAGPGEEALKETIRTVTDRRVTILPPLSLRTAAAVIGELDFFLCNDTGVMHIAAALGTPTLALFGPTDPEFWAPVSPNVEWLRAPDPNMASLTVDEVMGEIRMRLENLKAVGENRHGGDSGSG
jgi:heptosyltransferase-2